MHLDKTLNFLVYSADDYTIQLNRIKLKEDYDTGIKGSLQLHGHALLSYFRKGDNIIYIGVLCIVLSIIIYFIDITTHR